ncbi:MAG: hypothetical protein IIU96_01425 [Paludibacteraceae bacterium]|nr:hypothetical protein [Paludibacteraceae bacterium]
MKNYKLIPKVTVLVLMLVGILTAVMFFAGGSEGSLEVAGDFLNIPKFTDLLLYWIYVLVGLVILVTFGFVLAKLVETFKVDPKAGIRSVLVVLAAVGLVALCWFLGSPEKVEILGYEGTDNVGTMARLSDAIMYLVYILTASTVAALVWGVIYTKVKK